MGAPTNSTLEWTPGPGSTHVLVLGRRLGLEAALRRRGTPYTLWVDRAPERPPVGIRVEVAPFPTERRAVERVTARLLGGPPITHCIAAVEGAVVAASLARRLLGARSSPHTVAVRCHDKLFMKRRLADAGVRVAEFARLGHPGDLERADRLGRPLVVKERSSSGSRGLEVISEGALEAEVSRPGRMAERFVRGEEMSVESFVHEHRVVWTSTTCYWRPRHVNVVPSGLAGGALERVLDVNRRALEALAVRWGMTHLELFLTPEGPVVGEVALRAPGGYLMRCIELAYGFDPWEALCAVELGESPGALPTRARPTAVVVLHPGRAGRVAAIRGEAEVRAHPAQVDTVLKVGPGDEVPERTGVGVDVGRVLLQADGRPELEQAIRLVEARLEVELEAGVPGAPGAPDATGATGAPGASGATGAPGASGPEAGPAPC